MNIANKIVANAIKAQTARNNVEVEVSLMYAGRVQHAMRDAVRTVSGVRMASTNTLICPDEDAADEVVDILEQAGVPKREISLNAECVANATYKWSSTEAKVGDRVRVVGALGTYVVTKVDGEWIEIKDADDGTLQDRVMARFAIPVKNAKRTARNGYDSAGLMTPGTKVKLKNGDIAEVVQVKRIYSHGFVEPEYTVRLPNGRLWILSGEYTMLNAVARNADYTDATNKLRFCLDSLYKADDYRNEAVRTVAQLINEGVIDKSAASKMNELQKLFEQAMAIGKDLYYNKLRP